MKLSTYHEKYASRSDDEMQTRADVKEEELRRVFKQLDINFESETIRVFVVGCGERRLVSHHKRILEELTGKKVDQVTSDISIDHLSGAEGVIQHNAIEPLPGAPYDIVYAHVFLKFIESDLQWTVVKNTYDALIDGGVAIHVFDREEIDATEETIADGAYAVSLGGLKGHLSELSISYEVIEWTIEGILPMPLAGLALVLRK
ncbi:MAG TPA: hypothetical protein QF873_02405 [Patescibacteria group bacterium]|nr:hypothetical protein [Patescibacteria group bacterium]|tara:strand:+ start:100 stop:708 length:609 start_codon:yes stop_codon:yes gene_type:complete